MKIESAIGHSDTANIVSKLLGYKLPKNRVSIEIDFGILLIIAQYTGTRLPEGATELPEGAELNFWLAFKIQV